MLVQCIFLEQGPFGTLLAVIIPSRYSGSFWFPSYLRNLPSISFWFLFKGVFQVSLLSFGKVFFFSLEDPVTCSFLPFGLPRFPPSRRTQFILSSCFSPLLSTFPSYPTSLYTVFFRVKSEQVSAPLLVSPLYCFVPYPVLCSFLHPSSDLSPPPRLDPLSGRISFCICFCLSFVPSGLFFNEIEFFLALFCEEWRCFMQPYQCPFPPVAISRLVTHSFPFLYFLTHC